MSYIAHLLYSYIALSRDNFFDIPNTILKRTEKLPYTYNGLFL